MTRLTTTKCEYFSKYKNLNNILNICTGRDKITLPNLTDDKRPSNSDDPVLQELVRTGLKLQLTLKLTTTTKKTPTD